MEAAPEGEIVRRSVKSLTTRLLLRAIGAAVVFGCAARGVEGRVIFSFDYSLDQGGLFDSTAAGRAAQAAMERAGQILSDRLGDSLTAITPGSGNSWSPRIVNPGTGVADYDPGLGNVAANVIKVYVGSRLLTGLELGLAGAGTAVTGGSQTFVDNAAGRGQAGALAATKTDYGPWGGSIAFDAATNWYFGLTPGGLTLSKMDFLTVAEHELIHLLGFSTSQPSWARLVSNGKFTGAVATAANGGVAPDVTGSHWLNMNSPVGVGGPVQVALMDPTTPSGVRRRITQLDWAALADAGWEVAIPGDANANGVVDFGDFQALELGFGKSDARWSQGDFNEDGLVDTADFVMLLRNYGKRSDGGTEPMSAAELQTMEAFARAARVPEPRGVLVLGLVGAGMMRRRRRVRFRR